MKPDPEKKQAAGRAAQQLNLRLGEGAVRRMDELPGHAEALSTGILGIDHVLGVGGVPRGRITELYGDAGCGKTTLALQLVAQTQRGGGTAAWIDAEHAFDPAYARALGVDVPELYFSQPMTGEEALITAVRLVETGVPDLVVLDSVAALLPGEELREELSCGRPGAQARMLSIGLRGLNRAVGSSSAAALLLNQLRTDIRPSASGTGRDRTAGGLALGFYASVRLELKLLYHLMSGEECTGSRLRLTARKNRLAPPYTGVELESRLGRGIDPVTDLVEQCLIMGILQREGRLIRMGRVREEGPEAMAERLRQHPEEAERLRRRLLLRWREDGPVPVPCEAQLLQEDILTEPRLPEPPVCEPAEEKRSVR